MDNKPTAFFTLPTVYTVHDTYQIIVPVTCETVMWASIGGEEFYDDSNGVLRSAVTTHKIIVPREKLDRAGAYTICWRKILKRLPYNSETGEVETFTSPFRPVSGDTIRVCHIADAHNMIEPPIAAGGYFGDKLDALILNGDIHEDSRRLEHFETIHKIAAGISKGQIPVVFSRGNHDLRGIYAETLAEHTPTENGNSYFTFRLGSLWGVVLDCGEDKSDDNPSYGHTVCCHAFRRRQTEFLKSLIDDAGNEYAAPDVKHKIVVSHNTFTRYFQPPFDIEDEIYSEWTNLLRTYIKPEVMLCGHVHKLYVSDIGSEYDNRGQPCPVVSGSALDRKIGYFAGANLTFTDHQINVIFNDSNQTVLSEHNIPIRR